MKTPSGKFTTNSLTHRPLFVNRMQSTCKPFAKHRLPLLEHNNVMESKMPVRVLVIDDDPAMTELLALILRTKGFEVLVANSGADGVKSVCKTTQKAR